MTGKKLFKFLSVLFVAVIIVFAAAFLITGGGMAARGEAGESKTIIIPASDKFQTNLKGTKSIISMSVHLEVIEDKKLLGTIKIRDPEARSRVLDILRDKTIEEVSGTEGKKTLEREILGCYRSLYGQANILSTYIDDFITQ
jgi:flagellar FliL protein